MSIRSAAGTASHIYTWLSITEPNQLDAAGSAHEEELNSILKIASHLAAEVKYKSSAEWE